MVFFLGISNHTGNEDFASIQEKWHLIYKMTDSPQIKTIYAPTWSFNLI